MEKVAPLPLVWATDELPGGYARALAKASRRLRVSQTQIPSDKEEDRATRIGRAFSSPFFLFSILAVYDDSLLEGGILGPKHIKKCVISHPVRFFVPPSAQVFVLLFHNDGFEFFEMPLIFLFLFKYPLVLVDIYMLSYFGFYHVLQIVQFQTVYP